MDVSRGDVRLFPVSCVLVDSYWAGWRSLFSKGTSYSFVALQFGRLFDDLHLFSLLCWQFRSFASTWRYWPTHRRDPPKSGRSTGEVEQDWLGNLLDLWRYIFGFKSKDNLTKRASASDYTGVYFSFAYMERRITMPIRRSIRPAFLWTSLAPRPNMLASTVLSTS